MLVVASVLLAAWSGRAVLGQDAPPPLPTPGDNVRYGYTVHQSVDLGGHIASRSGSGAMYDTLLNLKSGPRVLDYDLDLRALNSKHAFIFDTLTAHGFGYGGDPNSVSLLNASKGKLYDFRGSFRRSRQYFDYNLLDNPLIPPSSTPFDPVLDSPHLFNTVRRNTDLNLTVEPLSPVSLRLGYNHTIMQGPSYSSMHEGTEALLLQIWRNSTDSGVIGVDWKPLPRTTVSYDQFLSNYKGDTAWQLTGLNYQLSNGTPVSLGIDISSVWKTPCAAPLTTSGTVTPTCNAYLGYTRSAPTRTFIPSEQLRFQSSAIPHFTLNGRLLYTGFTSRVKNFNENFNGLISRNSFRESVVTGSASTERVNVNGDINLAWQITPKIEATDGFNFWDFRMPGVNTYTETDYTGKTLLTPPSSPTTTTTPDYQFLNQKTKTNTFLVAWDAIPRARFSLGYRYRSRIITDAGGDFIPIHENWGILGMALRPTPQWRVNFDGEAMYADNAFTRISPRQMQHYRLRTSYKPHAWLDFNGAINIRESRDNVQTVNHLDHIRDFSLGTVVSPNERWSLDMNYGYTSVYSSTIECYAATPAPTNTSATAPAVCVAAGTPYASNGYYNAPTQFGSAGFMFAAAKQVHFRGGYRISSVDGNSDVVNIRQVPGSLQSQYQSPYGAVAIDIAKNWSWKADYNFYGYGEGSPVGPTAPRNFHGNIATLAVNYAF